MTRATPTIDGTAQHDLACLMERVCVAPFAEYRWKTRRLRRLWVDAEGIVDAMAGPMSAIESRDCRYMYRDAARFPGVRDPDGVGLYLRGWYFRLRTIIEEVRPRTVMEREDFAYLLETLEFLDEAISLAVRIERRRFAGDSPR